MGAGGRLGAELPPAGPAPQGLGQPEAAADVTPLPPAGRPAAVPGAAGGGTHEQSRRAGAAAGGDCPQGLPVLQDLAGGPRLRCLYQRDPDPLEEGRTVHRGGSPSRSLLRPKKRECSRLTPQNPCAIQLPRTTLPSPQYPLPSSLASPSASASTPRCCSSSLTPSSCQPV